MNDSPETGSPIFPESQNPREVIAAWRERARRLREQVATLPPDFILAFDTALKTWESAFESDDAIGTVLNLLGQAIQQVQQEGGKPSEFDQTVITYLLEVRRGVQLGMMQNHQLIEGDLKELEKVVALAKQRIDG